MTKDKEPYHEGE